MKHKKLGKAKAQSWRKWIQTGKLYSARCFSTAFFSYEATAEIGC